jgi:hypothetical protein
VVLLAFVLFINFVDRGNLATAAPLIKDGLHLSSTQLGLLLSSFFWSHTLCLFPVGWLAERFGAKPVLTAGVVIWSLGTPDPLERVANDRGAARDRPMDGRAIDGRKCRRSWDERPSKSVDPDVFASA